jgi:hypothetical protein
MSGNVRFPTAAGVSPSTSRPAQLADLAEQLLRKVDRNSEAVFTTVVLRSPGGAYFRVRVDDAGALSTEPFS